MERVPGTPWGPGAWHLALYGAWFTPLVPLVVLARAVGATHTRLLVPLALAAGAWAASEVWLATCALPWYRIALLQIVWSLAGGLVCAAAAMAFVRRGWLPTRSEAPAVRRPASAVVAGTALLFYCAALGDAAFVSVTSRMFDPATRRLISPMVLVMALPGLALGAGLAVFWQRRLGAVTVRTLANFFVGTHVVLTGMVIFFILDQWISHVIAPPAHVSERIHQLTVGYGCLAVFLAPIPVYGYYVSLAPRVPAVFARAFVCLCLSLLGLLQLEVGTGTSGLVRRYRAVGDERAAEPGRQRRAVRDWKTYLAIFPDTEERPDALWRIGTALARLGENDRARATYTALARLPEDGVGATRVRAAKLIVAAAPAASDAARVQAPVSIFEHADYLDADWRSALTLLGAGNALPRQEFLAKLRLVSRSTAKIVLPRLTSLFEVKAYGRLLGVEVDLRATPLGEVKRLLADGNPVLIRGNDRWLCLIGFDPRWGTLLYYDYAHETDRVRRAHTQAEARAMFDGSAAGSKSRLGGLEGSLIEEIPEADVARMLADHHELTATLVRPGAPPSSRAWDDFLVGDLAFEGGDPAAALEHYAAAAAGFPGSSWPLLYVHLARLASEDPPRQVVARRLLPNPVAEELAAWRRQEGHEALLARAKAAFEGRNPADLPAPILARLAALGSTDRARRLRCWETLVARYPEHVPYLTALADAYRQDGNLASLLAVERRLAGVEPGKTQHQLHLADTLLALDRPGESRQILERIYQRGLASDDHYAALAGRTARALGEHRRAARLLRQALAENPAEPDLGAELALALEGLGDGAQALTQWRWADFAAIEAEHRDLAAERVKDR